MLSESKYKELRERIDKHYAWLQARDFKPYKTEECPQVLRVTNEEYGAVEVYEWHNDPPDKYFAYVKVGCVYVDGVGTYEATVTTWMGDTIGHAGLGCKYRSNFGDIRVPISVTGTNDKHYYGTYYKSAGDYCRLTAYKEARNG